MHVWVRLDIANRTSIKYYTNFDWDSTISVMRYVKTKQIRMLRLNVYGVHVYVLNPITYITYTPNHLPMLHFRFIEFTDVEMK